MADGRGLMGDGGGSLSSRSSAVRRQSFPTGRLRSDAPLLGRAAAVVRERGDVFDGLDREPRSLERGDGALAARAGALDLDLDLLDAVLRGGRRGGLGRALGGERRALAAPLEPDGPGRGP